MKEGKLEKLARQAIEYQEFQAAQQQKDREKYPKCLMKILERATKVGFDISIKDSMFVISDYESHINDIRVSPTYSEDSLEALGDLEMRVFAEEHRQSEEKRKYAIRVAALEKLTREERDVLGL
jgi:hypothetical protein